MIIDGVFTHHLVNELKEQLVSKRINKVTVIDNTSFLFYLQNKLQLFISLNPDICHMRLTENEFISSNKLFPFFTSLKKYLESSLILDIKQEENDRIIKIIFESSDDLGFKHIIHMYLEFFGRNSNLFITNEDDIILDCLKRTFVLEDNDQRILVPKMKYTTPVDNKINPFKTTETIDTNNYQGLSNLCYSEVIYRNDISFIKQNPIPQLIKANNKTYFYCFDLIHLNGEKQEFSSLSKVLEEYYNTKQNQSNQNHEQRLLENYIKKEITKVRKKIEKQKQEKEKANKNLNLQYIGNLLSANLYKVKKNDSKIIVYDFYNNNEEVLIELNPLISPSRNLENIFNRYKKAKRAVDAITDVIESSKNELEYLLTLETQLGLAKHNELKEIIEELGLIKTPTKQKKKLKPQLEVYTDNLGNKIWVGKNNIQNNYLTHEFAKKDDYFFHVKATSGSHTILRVQELNDDVLILAAQIAAYYSKSRNSSNVAVDYTKVSNVRKVPKMKGSFVTYTNFKTVFVTPDLDYIKNNTK